MGDKPDRYGQRAPLLSVFSAFLKVGLTSFGGGTSAWMQREVVERHRWLTNDEFLATLSVSQILPGANPVNMAVYLGVQLRGGLGALVAAVGMIVPSFCVILILGALYTYLSSMPATQTVLGGLAMVGVGATLAVGLKSVRKFQRSLVPMLVTVVTFGAVGLLRWPLIPVILVAIPCSILFSFYQDRQRAHAE